MNLTRRQVMQWMGGAATALAVRGTFAEAAAAGTSNGIDVTPGRFTNTRESLKAYTIPDWFGDAKFGIWSHWGPQSATEQGDWFARRMYQEDSDAYNWFVKNFGPQSKVGYKDVIPTFKADRWDPEHLMDLYVKAGAKYFFSMGVHHDNYDMWNSKYQPRWNSVATGPKKDIVGMWAKAARKRGLRFGVSEHLALSYTWWNVAHMADTKGPFAGRPYDGANPAFADLYQDYSMQPADFLKTMKYNDRSLAPPAFRLQFFQRIKDLVDQHKPDMLYTDGGIPFEEYGLGTVAEIYNVKAVGATGKTDGIYLSKSQQDYKDGICVLDRERRVSSGIWPVPWQTDTCIGEFHYHAGVKYASPKKVIDQLVDIVSKNGNLLLNFPLPGSGELDADARVVLQGITAWMSVNSEGIFSSKPWKIYGEGPSVRYKDPVVPKGTKRPDKPDLMAEDIRFTTKGRTLYAFVQGWPEGELVIKSLAANSPQKPAKAVEVGMLGRDQALKFTQDSTGLRVTLPPDKPATADIGVTMRVKFA